MTAVPLAVVLTEFGSAGLPQFSSSGGPAKSHPDDELEHAAVPAVPDRAPAALSVPDPTAIQEAFEDGLAQGRREAEALAAKIRDEQTAMVEQRLESARREWVECQADRLADDIAARIDDMRRALAEGVVAAMAPIVNAKLVEGGLENLAEQVRRHAATNAAAAIRITGPQDLIRALGDRLGEAGGRVVLVPADGDDVEVSLDDTVLATQIGRWREAVREVLA